MPTDSNDTSKELSRLLHSGDAPRSPGELDQRILQHARQRAREYGAEAGVDQRGWLWQHWKPAAAFASVTVIAVSVTLQGNYQRGGFQGASAPQPVTAESSPRAEPQAPSAVATGQSIPVASNESVETSRLAEEERAEEDLADALAANSPLQPTDTASRNQGVAQTEQLQNRADRQAVEEPVVVQQEARAGGAADQQQAVRERQVRIPPNASATSTPASSTALLADSNTAQAPQPTLADFLAQVTRSTETAAFSDQDSTTGRAEQRRQLQRVLALVDSVLVESEPVRELESESSSVAVPAYSELVAQAENLLQRIQPGDTVAGGRSAASPEAGWQSGAADFEGLELPASFEETVALLQDWLAAQ